MHIIAMNGSPRLTGNTAIALGWMADELAREGITVTTVQLGDKAFRGCAACDRCNSPEDTLCALPDDGINDLIRMLRAADGFIIGSPTYFGGMAGTLKSVLDRVFYAGRRNGGFRNKIGGAAVAVRRGGGAEAYNQLITYFHLSGMVVAPSQSWGQAFGARKGEVAQDVEGQQLLRLHANAMAWLLKMKVATKDSIPLPRVEDRVLMNFIR